MTVYTIGGGEIIFNIMQAVALCLNGGGGQFGGSLSGGVSATNSDNTGATKQFNSSEDISEVQRRFESNMKEISNSSRKDNLTQLARDHVKTLQENESLSNIRHIAKAGRKCIWTVTTKPGLSAMPNA